MIRRLVMLVVVLACGVVWGQNGQPDEHTGGWINGQFWRGLNRSQKSGYVLGVWDGWISAMLKANRPDYKALDTGHMNSGEVADAIDKVYAQPENLTIPVFEVLDIVTQKAQGKSEEEAQKLLAELRKNWAAVPTPQPDFQGTKPPATKEEQ